MEYIHLGDIGRWLVAYPAAFFTLGLCVVMLIVVVATIRESSTSEGSAICNEQGAPYEKQPIPRNWTRGFVITAIVFMVIISYGTYRYYQISVGHFKVNANTNIILPTLPLAPPAPVPDHPPSLADVFEGDFPTLMKARNDLSIEGTIFPMKQQVYLDFPGKAEFVGFYVPASPDPISGTNTSKVCMMLIDQVQVALDGLLKKLKIKQGFGFEGNTLDELTFTGRVLIYHDELLSITQRAEIINAYKLKHLDVQFRGQEYLMNQIYTWRQQRDSKQGH
jgi:hypothetical protein